VSHHAVKIRHKKNGAALLIPAFLAVMAVIGWFWYSNSRYEYFIKTPVDPTDDAKISLTIKKGESPAIVAKNLKEKDLILDEDAFKSFLRSSDIDRKIVAGRFMLDKTQTIPEISGVITDSKQSEFIITVPEGSTVTDIDKKLVELDVIKSGDFILAVKDFSDYDKYPFLDKEKSSKLVHPLEGYLFPDTYYLDPQNFYSEDLIQMMLNNFKKKLGDELTKEHSRSLFEVITMASILEKEVRTSGDLPKVSGILWKRLDNGWMLGADATLLYLKEDRSIDYKDLQEENPYNTRNKTGLPPGPINNPGLKSIMAALNPEDSPYFFYLTKPDTGEVVYAVTNDEHNANKRKYLN
jgi:UPF0755 protein